MVGGGASELTSNKLSSEPPMFQKLVQRSYRRVELQMECEGVRIPHALKSPGLRIDAVAKAMMQWLEE